MNLHPERDYPPVQWAAMMQQEHDKAASEVKTLKRALVVAQNALGVAEYRLKKALQAVKKQDVTKV